MVWAGRQVGMRTRVRGRLCVRARSLQSAWNLLFLQGPPQVQDERRKADWTHIVLDCSGDVSRCSSAPTGKPGLVDLYWYRTLPPRIPQLSFGRQEPFEAGRTGLASGFPAPLSPSRRRLAQDRWRRVQICARDGAVRCRAVLSGRVWTLCCMRVVSGPSRPAQVGSTPQEAKQHQLRLR